MKSSESRIMVSGMSEAGSTLCFNLARVLLLESGVGVVISVQEDPPLHLGMNPWTSPTGQRCALLKQHDLSPVSALNVGNPGWETAKRENNLTVIRVVRDLRDAAASRIRKNSVKKWNLELIKEMCDRNLSYYETWEHVVDYDWCYEKYKEDPIHIVKEMQSVLGTHNSDEDLARIINECEGLKNYYESGEALRNPQDAESFELLTRLTKHHVTNKGKIGSYKTFFTQSEIEFMNSRYGDWLIKQGYHCDEKL